MATATQVANTPAPAAYFGLPGISRKTYQKENNDGLVTTLSQTNQVSMTGLIPFKQTDVILFWELQFTLAQVVAAGTQTVTASTYFPYNFLGPVNLNFQNQFNSIHAESGIDLALWQSYRPARQTDNRNALYTNFANSHLYSAAPNLVSSGSYTSAITSLALRYELPAGLWFQKYYELAPDGTIQSPPLHTFVTPQYMGGSARIVQPQITFNPAFASTGDQGPYTISGSPTTPATFTGGSSTVNIRRAGYYQPMGAADSPPVYNWQYTRQAKPFSIAGRSTVDIPVPLNGQILSIFVRLFDPTLNSGAGGPIPLANLTECDVVYGSGLYRFQDTPTDMQARFVSQHNFLPTNGVLIWDMAIDDEGNLTNADALNTMNTSGVIIHLVFTAAQSASAYAVVGVEALTYVQA